MLSMLERKDIISKYEATGSIRAVARDLGISRRTARAYVNEYVAARNAGDDALTAYLKSEPRYKTPVREKTALTEQVRSLLDCYLEENERKRLRGDGKLRMKATDMHQALTALGFVVSYPSVCSYIHRKRLAGAPPQECFIRQAYRPGEDCEFDWGEFYLTIGGRRTKVYVAVFTLCYSNHRMAYLFLHQDTQAFLESHRQYFRDVSGVPRRMVYDNMRVAVASFVGGKHPTDALIRMEAAYGFRHRFCNARSGNEKGHVERSVELVRRKAFCMNDRFDRLADAQYQLTDTCVDLNGAPLSPATQYIVERSEEDLKALLPIRKEIGCSEHGTYHVDKYATVLIKGVRYSVPETLVGQKVTALIFSNDLAIYSGDKKVAHHERTAVNGWKLDLMHYLATFKRKPGSVAGSAALSMAAAELRELFEEHFSDCPADFVLLLEMTRSHDLALEEIPLSLAMMEANGVRPSLDAFRQYMLHEGETPKPAQVTASAAEIEKYSMQGLRDTAALLTATPNTGGYATT